MENPPNTKQYRTTSGLYISLDVIPSWSDPGACSPSAFDDDFLSRRHKCRKRECHLVDVFLLPHVFRVLHVLPTSSMLFHPGWQNETVVEPCTTYNSECCRNFSAVQSFSLTKNDGFERILQSGLRASFVQDVCLLTGWKPNHRLCGNF